jgi:hypothetical protein
MPNSLFEKRSANHTMVPASAWARGSALARKADTSSSFPGLATRRATMASLVVMGILLWRRCGVMDSR